MWSVFSIANRIEDEQQVAVFLSVLNTKTYSLLWNLVALEEPKSKSVPDLLQIWQHHIEPNAMVIAERFKFHQSTRKGWKKALLSL